MSNEITSDETESPVTGFATPRPPPGPRAAAVPPADLSEEVARAVARRPGEQVTCRRVGDHHYRCNWWVPESAAKYDNPCMKASLVTTSRIGLSQFLHVTKAGRALEIRVDTRTTPRRTWPVG
jgi:hypothetical protein